LKNYEETDSRLDAVRQEVTLEPVTERDTAEMNQFIEIEAAANAILAGPKCMRGQHDKCTRTSAQCGCACHKAAATEPEPQSTGSARTAGEPEIPANDQEGARAMSNTSPQCQIGDHKDCKVISKSGIHCACYCHQTAEERQAKREQEHAESAAFRAAHPDYIPTYVPSNADMERQFEHDTGVKKVRDDGGREQDFYDFADLQIAAGETYISRNCQEHDPRFTCNDSRCMCACHKPASTGFARTAGEPERHEETTDELDGGEYGRVCLDCLQPATENVNSTWYCTAHAPKQEEEKVSAGAGWGGLREPRGGRPKSERSEPLYQSGYQAGYKAQDRKKAVKLVKRTEQVWKLYKGDTCVAIVQDGKCVRGWMNAQTYGTITTTSDGRDWWWVGEDVEALKENGFRYSHTNERYIGSKTGREYFQDGEGNWFCNWEEDGEMYEAEVKGPVEIAE
jgi:hypothetical protein